MQAFVVRPFNTKNNIDFELVHCVLIEPALKAANINGGTTGVIFEAGNIREDMFQLLLLADVVIADISIQNANVFYELGVRHALRPHWTYMIRAAVTKPREQRGPEDQVPFDLSTDRYLEYDATDPAACLDTLVHGLKETITGGRTDSPVFRSLPLLQVPGRSSLFPVPTDFVNDIDPAAELGQTGKLGLLASEAAWFLWQESGLRMVARKQSDFSLWLPARDTWEKLRKDCPDDREANLKLGTVYQKLGDLTLSDQRLQQALANPALERKEKAEALALLASNQKVRGRATFRKSGSPSGRIAVLQSRLFERSAELYQQAFEQDLNHFYSGLNALSLTTLLLDIIEAEKEAWLNLYDSEALATSRENELRTKKDRLAAAVGLSLEASAVKDIWLVISQADYKFLTSLRDPAVAAAYVAALVDAKPSQISIARAQLELFRDMNVRSARVKACLDSFPPVSEPPQPLAQAIVFTGHMVDAPDRPTPRFPPHKEDLARKAIHKTVSDLLASTPGKALGIAGGANGGDILFHEVCAELGIPTRVLLTLPPGPFSAESVAHGGPEWLKRFNALIKDRKADLLQILGQTKDLPSWMRDRPGYDVWQRTNLWLLEETIATAAPAQTLIALWDGKSGDGPGGTKHLVELARDKGLVTEILLTTVVFADAKM